MTNAHEDKLAVVVAQTAQEIREIQRLRYEVYATEMGLDLPGLDHYERTWREEMDDPAIHLYATSGSRIVGAVRINENRVPKGLESILEIRALPRPFCYCSRLYVSKQWRGGSIVTRLAAQCFTEFRGLNALVAICHCYPHLQRLYERMGFRPYGKPFIQTGLDSLGWQRPLMCVLQPTMLLRSA